MDRETMVKCFNEWMRRFTEDPDGFRSDFASAKQFLAEQAEGREPTYGEMSAAYMEKIAADLHG